MAHTRYLNNRVPHLVNSRIIRSESAAVETEAMARIFQDLLPSIFNSLERDRQKERLFSQPDTKSNLEEAALILFNTHLCRPRTNVDDEILKKSNLSRNGMNECNNVTLFRSCVKSLFHPFFSKLTKIAR